MKNTFLNINGVSILTKQQQKELNGGGSFKGKDLGKCGCDCAGRVTGPFYCQTLIACPQVYTCNEES